MSHLRPALAAAVALAAATIGISPASAAPVEPLSASGYRDSVGVNMHYTFTGHPYDRASNTKLASMLEDVGVWHVRDMVCFSKDAECVRPHSRMADLRDQATKLGLPPVEFLMGITPEVQGMPGRAARDTQIERALDAVSKPPLSKVVTSLEQANEPDLQKQATWPAISVADDATIRAKLSEPRYAELRKMKMLAPAVGHADNTPKLLAGGWKSSPDLTPNFHPYPAAWGGPENALGGKCSGPSTVLDCVGQIVPGGEKPWATESGYSTTGLPIATNFVSRQAQAIYLPRLLLDNYARGVARTYLYELADLNADPWNVVSGYGLYGARYQDFWNFTVSNIKPAGIALHRLHERIGDAGAAAPAAGGALDLDLRDAAGKELADTAVRRVLLRRTDGSYVLALWQPKSVFSNAPFQQRNLKVTELKVQVGVNTPSPNGWTATTFRPTSRDSAIRNTGNSFTVPVSGEVSLIDLRDSKSTTAIPGGPVKLG